MQDLIQDRASTIKLVSETMKNIGELTADIKEQTQLQGTKMDLIDEDLVGAQDNVEEANDQLAEKMDTERTGNKCLMCCVITAVLLVVILIIMAFVRDNDVEIEIVNTNGEVSTTTS